MNTVTYRQELLEQGIDLGSLGAVRAELRGINDSGAVTFRPERWDEPTSNYRVAAGDTLAGLAALYLNAAGRAMELWNYQHESRKVDGNPNEIYVDEWLVMPPEALTNMRAMRGDAGGGGGGGGGGNGGNGGSTAQPMSTAKKVAIAAGAGAIAIGIVYLATR